MKRPQPILRVLVTLTLAALLLSGCNRWSPVPEDHLSLSQSPGEDPGPPPTRLSMVWHHHSTGDDLLAGGLRAALDGNNIAFHDINYKEAKVGFTIPGVGKLEFWRSG